MKPYEAARVLYQNGAASDARAILERLWDSPELRGSDEFRIFCALVETWAEQSTTSVMGFLDSVIAGEGDLHGFWERRNMAEQATLLEWHGQFAYVSGDRGTAFSSLTRAASLGRDTSIVWRLIGAIHIENEELELGMRYLRRSLQLYRQLELDLLSGRDYPLGFFTGKNPLNLSHGPADFLNILLDVTRLAKGQRNLKSVRELVVELIHHNPSDERLLKIRVLLERAIVQASLVPGNRPQVSQQSLNAVAAQAPISAAAPMPLSRTPAPVVNPRGYAALFRG